MSFAPTGNAGGGGAPSTGGLSGLGQAAGMAGQLGALAGVPGAGLLNGVASAIQPRSFMSRGFPTSSSRCATSAPS